MWHGMRCKVLKGGSFAVCGKSGTGSEDRNVCLSRQEVDGEGGTGNIEEGN